MVTFPLAHQSALALRAALPGGAVAVEKFDRGTHPPKRPELAMAADFIRRRLSSTEGLGPMPPGTEAGAAVGVETTADAALASCVGEGSGSGGDGGGSGGDVRGCGKGQGGGGGGEGGGSGGEGGGGRGGKGGPSSSVPRVYSPLERSGTARTCEAAPAPPRSPPPPPSPPRVAAPLPSLLRREVTRTFALGGAKLPPLILTLTLTTHPTPTPNLTPAPNANQATLAFDPAEHELHAATVSLLRSLGDRYGTFTVTEATGGAAGGAVGGAAGDAAARGCLLAGYRPAQGNPFTNFRLSQRLYAAGARDERLLAAYDRLVVSVVLPHLKALLAQAGGAEGGGAEGGGGGESGAAIEAVLQPRAFAHMLAAELTLQLASDAATEADGRVGVVLALLLRHGLLAAARTPSVGACNPMHPGCSPIAPRLRPHAPRSARCAAAGATTSRGAARPRVHGSPRRRRAAAGRGSGADGASHGAHRRWRSHPPWGRACPL